MTKQDDKLDRSRLAAIALFVVGAASWFVVAKMSGRREPWDGPLYFPVFLPVLAIVVAAVSWRFPERPWRWAFLPFLGQAAAAFVQNPAANLMPLGLVVFGILGALFLVPALFGSRLRRARDRGNASG